jgi:hypothetical protein
MCGYVNVWVCALMKTKFKIFLRKRLRDIFGVCLGYVSGVVGRVGVWACRCVRERESVYKILEFENKKLIIYLVCECVRACVNVCGWCGWRVNLII